MNDKVPLALDPYGSKIYELDVPPFGAVKYAQWCHPLVVHHPFNYAWLAQLKRFINPGDVVIDIGAHMGDTTLPMALAAGRTGRTLAFEPNPYAFSVLQQNAILNSSKTNIECFREAIMDRPGRYTFYYTEAGLCNGGSVDTLVQRAAWHISPCDVDAVNLTDWLTAEVPDLSQITFIKMDTEGYDKDIIRSNLSFIQKYRPVLHVEVFPLLVETERRELYTLLRGYDLFYEGTQVQVTERMIVEDTRLFNIDCIPSA